MADLGGLSDRLHAIDLSDDDDDDIVRDEITPPAAPKSSAAEGQAPLEEKDPNASEDATKTKKKKPTVIINIGMAGSGKSTLMHRMFLTLLAEGKKVYGINLDPAVREVKYPCGIDIRDTIKYKEVMKHFELGPNGAIMTSLNLFATRFDQVLQIVDKRAEDLDYILIDTPGQIEVFSWSASGQIVCDSLSVEYPTIINYVIDTERCQRPVTFMSNMLYACSILYKTKLPFVCSFNKTDVSPCTLQKKWLTDYRSFAEAISRDEKTYLSSLSKSMARTLEEFYSKLNCCGVSAATGDGVKTEFFAKCIPEAEKEYEEEFLSYLQSQKANIEAKREKQIAERLKQFEKNLDRSNKKCEDIIGTIGEEEGAQKNPLKDGVIGYQYHDMIFGRFW